MPAWLESWGTLVIAAWGAVTGTLALGHRWWVARQDRGRLRVVTGLSVDDTVPPKLTLEVQLANIGRRPLQLSKYVLEQPWIAFLPWRVAPWRTVHVVPQRRRLVLEEADQASYPVVEVPQEALRISRRLRVVDTRGKSWRSKPTLDGARIVKERSVEPIEEEAWGEDGEPGFVHLALYPPVPGSTRYRLQGRFVSLHQLAESDSWGHPKPPPKSLLAERFRSLEAGRDGYAKAAAFAQVFHDRGGKLRSPYSLRARDLGTRLLEPL